MLFTIFDVMAEYLLQANNNKRVKGGPGFSCQHARKQERPVGVAKHRCEDRGHVPQH